MPVVVERQQRQQPVDAIGGLLRGQIAQLADHDQVFEAGEVRVEMRLFGHVAHALLPGDRIASESGWPSKRISPDVISISPVIIFMVVDLPDPFGPR